MTEAAEITLTLNKNEEDNDVTDGSTADVEEDNTEIMKDGLERKKRMVKKKRKIYFRSDFVGDDSSCSSSDDEGGKKKTSSTSIVDQNPVCNVNLSVCLNFWLVPIMYLYRKIFSTEKNLVMI